MSWLLFLPMYLFTYEFYFALAVAADVTFVIFWVMIYYQSACLFADYWNDDTSSDIL